MPSSRKAFVPGLCPAKSDAFVPSITAFKHRSSASSHNAPKINCLQYIAPDRYARFQK